MNIEDALRVLKVKSSDTQDTARAAYRDLIVTHHPDRAGSAAVASQVTAAWALVEAAYVSGELPYDPPPAPAAPAPKQLDNLLRLHIDDPDPFVYLLDVAHRVGDLTYQEREAGLLQMLVDEPGYALSQLTAQVSRSGPTFTVEFALEAMGPGVAPDIELLVKRFGELSSRPDS